MSSNNQIDLPFSDRDTDLNIENLLDFGEELPIQFTHEGNEPTVDLMGDEAPLVAGGYIDDQSKWYDGTGEWLLYALGFLSGAAITAVAIYFLF